MTRSVQRRERVLEVLRNRQADLTVVLENIHDPHNVSAILRSCDAVGVLRVELLYTQERFPVVGKKSSSSANKWLQMRRHTSAQDCFHTLHREGFTIHATHLGGTAVSLYDLDLTEKVALVFGNEHRGVSDEIASMADGNFHIPMRGMIRSLNVSVAAAVSLYEGMRQRLRRGANTSSTIPDGDIAILFDEWMKR